MDVVARNVRWSLKGSVSVRSHGRAGGDRHGARAVDARDHRRVRRASCQRDVRHPDGKSVRECIGLARFERRRPASPPDFRDGVVNLRGEPLPYVRLRSMLGLSDRGAGSESVVVVEHQGVRAGLVVDALQGEMQAVIKPLGGGLEHLDRVAGSTILSDGRVALILDVPALLRDTMEEARP